MPTKSDKNFIFTYPDTKEYRNFVSKYQKPYKNAQKIPEIALPFQNLGYGDLTCLDYLEFTFCAIFLLIPRIILFILTVLLFMIFGNLACVGLKKENDISKSSWRKFLAWCCIVCVRLNALFCFGIYWIGRKGKPASQKDAPIRLMVPHSSYMDTIALSSPFPLGNLISFIIKADTTLGRLLPIEVVMAVRVFRGTEQGRDFVTHELQRRAEDLDGDWWPILLSPEGTALTGTVLHKFKLGAFKPGVPVQPVHFKIKNRGPLSPRQSLSFGDYYGDKPINHSIVLVYHMLFLWQSISIEYLDPIVPTEEEKNDPVKFADNTREKISKLINVPMHDTALEDSLLMKRFLLKFKGNPNYGIVKFVKLQVLYSANFKSVKKVFDHYIENYRVHLDKNTGAIEKSKFFELFSDIFNPQLLNGDLFKHFFGSKEDLPEILEFSDAIELLVFQVKAIHKTIKSRPSMIIPNEDDEKDEIDDQTRDGVVYLRDDIVGMSFESSESENVAGSERVQLTESKSLIQSFVDDSKSTNKQVAVEIQ